MAFEVFKKSMGPAANRGPSATLLKSGTLSLNAEAVKMLGTAKNVEVLYDPDERIIALRSSKAAHAYRVRMVDKGTGSAQITMSGLIRHYAIDMGSSLRMTPYESNGMVCMNLDDAEKVTRKPRAKTEG